MDKIKSILGASVLLFGSIAKAAFINATNTDTEYNTGLFADLQGLEWLSLDETLNKINFVSN